jgi:hypothetical protein
MSVRRPFNRLLALNLPAAVVDARALAQFIEVCSISFVSRCVRGHVSHVQINRRRACFGPLPSSCC